MYLLASFLERRRITLDFTIELSDEDLILSAETMVIMYITSVSLQTIARSDGNVDQPLELLGKSLEDSAAKLIRKQLKDALRVTAFRTRFYEHFSKHESDIVKEIGWPWLEKQLSWEGD